MVQQSEAKSEAKKPWVPSSKAESTHGQDLEKKRSRQSHASLNSNLKLRTSQKSQKTIGN